MSSATTPPSTWIKEDGLDDYTLILSRAELKFPFEMPEDFERFDTEHPDMIYAFTNIPWTSDTLRYYKPLDEVYSISNTGVIDRSALEYSMDITDYIQHLMNCNPEDIDASMDLWIAPMAARTNAYTSAIYYGFDNHNYNKIILNGPTAERRPTLNLTFGLMQK